MIVHSKPLIEDLDIQNVNDVLKTGNISKGDLNKEFINKIKAYLSATNIILTSSGSNALQTSLLLAGLKKGDEVIIPSYVCDSVFYSLISLEIKPVFCDIGENWVVSKTMVERKLTNKTKAIVLVHTFGIAVDVKNFLDLGITIIEDCCQSFGLKINNKYAGTIGDIGVFSFDATKCLTTGNGGAISINNKEIISKYRDNEELFTYFTGMSDIQCALGISQINRYDLFLKLRFEIAKNYKLVLEKNHIFHENNKTIYFRFPLKVKDDSKFIKFFRNRGIIIRKGVDELIHKKHGIKDILIETENTFKHTVSLPIYPAMTKQEIALVKETLNEWFINEY